MICKTADANGPAVHYPAGGRHLVSTAGQYVGGKQTTYEHKISLRRHGGLRRKSSRIASDVGRDTPLSGALNAGYHAVWST